MKILGISAFYHDSAAALVVDGQVIAAAQEERFTRKKHDANFPRQAADFCLKRAGITADDIDIVVFYDKPLLKFERILQTYLAYAPVGFRSFVKAIPTWMKQKLWIREAIEQELGFKKKILFTPHHESHAASAFFPSPYKDAAILTMDGVGEWATASLGMGKENRIELLKEIHFPHSLGLLYSAFTYYTGFKVNSGEYKVMGLAPYGEPKYKDLILNELMDLKEDGSFKLNMKYFNYCAGLTMTTSAFHDLFGGKPRPREGRIGEREMDLAASVQKACEEVMLRMARHARKVTGSKNLVLSGGVALNCVGNGKILAEKIFDNIWIQPAAGDAGSALGAALFVWYQYLNNPRMILNGTDLQQASLLGPSFSDEEIEASLKEMDVAYEKVPAERLPEQVAGFLAAEKVVGWFEGRMEFGPRALGARSILGDARSPKMQSVMNLKIKYRESFRPFAPSVSRERVSEYFEIDSDSPYMLLVAPVQPKIRRKMTVTEERLFGIEKLNVPRSVIPAITHVDYSARIQTVDEKRNPLYYQLIKQFEKKTGCPVIINTSFNVRGEPIVCRPSEAVKCFLRTEMDYLVVGNFILDKTKQKPLEKDTEWQKEFELD